MRGLYIKIMFFLGIFLFFPMEGQVQAISNQGETIMKQIMERIYALEDQTADITFTLTNDGGKPVKTELNFYWKNFKEDPRIENKTLLVTTFPPSERGESFLVWEYKIIKDSEFWMYLPELRQARKIQKLSVEDGLRESDLLFEDMSRLKIKRTTFKVLKEAIFEGERAFVIEAKSLDPSPYGKKLFWISKKRGVILKIEFLDSKADVIKTQTIQWEKLKGFDVWKGSRIKNRETHRTTDIQLKEIKINTNLSPRLFSPRNLGRGFSR